jgi:hypothetical protein
MCCLSTLFMHDVHQVTAELQKLDIGSAAIDAIFDVIQLNNVAELSQLLGQDSKVRGAWSLGSLHRHGQAAIHVTLVPEMVDI